MQYTKIQRDQEVSIPLYLFQCYYAESGIKIAQIVVFNLKTLHTQAIAVVPLCIPTTVLPQS